MSEQSEVGSPANLEIHASDPHGASGVRTLLEYVGLGDRVDVAYTPAI